MSSEIQRVSCSKFQKATLIRAPYIKLFSFNYQLQEPFAGVAVSTYPRHVMTSVDMFNLLIENEKYQNLKGSRLQF
jgi:hypothetical protein